MSSKNIDLNEDQQLALLNEWNSRPDDPPYIKELIELVEQYEAKVAGVVCIVDRTKDGVNFGCFTEALLRYPVVSWKPDECPLCEQGILITSRGRTGKK